MSTNATGKCSISPVCLILVQCFPLFDWCFKPLDQNQTPVICQNLEIMSSDELVLSSPLHISTTVFSSVHAPATFSNPTCTSTTLSNPLCTLNCFLLPPTFYSRVPQPGVPTYSSSWSNRVQSASPVTPLYLSSVHTLLTCTILSVIRPLITYVYYWPVYPRYRTHFGLSRYLDT